MFKNSAAFSGFSVNDLAAAKQFYGETLGLEVVEEPMGLELKLGSGGHVFIYPKPNHTPASFTILNFPVDDIDQAVADLEDKGVKMEHYHDNNLPQDDMGVLRGRAAGQGPDVAWFKDPAGNILSALQS